MKKLFTLLFVVCSFAVSKAQMADGSIAPDWTLTDINGQSHNLYSYLDSGYVVFLDFSATWCPPCWSYHNSNAFKDMHNNYGPGTAENKVRVFMIEGDASTNNADLLGQTAASMGDWTAGVPYPIIDDASITSSYQIGYWPTIYKVCPNRIITEIGQQNAAALWAAAEEADCQPATQAVDAQALSYDGGLSACHDGAWVNMDFTFMNFGTNPLTSATVNVLDDGGNVLATQNYSGSLNTYATATVNFGGVTVPSSGDYTFEVVANGDADATNNNITQAITLGSQTDRDTFKLVLTTDNFGYETFWAIVDDQNIMWAQGGNQDVGLLGGGAQAATPAGSGAYASNSTITEEIYLPVAPDGCYRFVIVDDYADGICCGQFGNGSYTFIAGTLSDPSATIASGGDFEASEESSYNTFSVATRNVAGLDAVKLFPNPTTVNLNVQFALENSQDLNINITNALGQVVEVVNSGALAAGEHNLSVNTSKLAGGMYFLSFSNGTQVTTKRFIVAE